MNKQKPKLSLKRVLTITAAIFAALLFGLVYLAPVWGLAAISANRYNNSPVDAERFIPVAGMFYTLAALVVIGFAIYWLATGRRKSGFHQVHAALAMILGALTAVAIRFRGIEQRVPGWEMWMLPVVGAAALGALFLILILVADLSQTARKESVAATTSD